jgi:hypothetical protein
MIVYKPSEKQFEPVARIKVFATPTYAYPIFTGNRIYIRDQDTAALYTLE